jgi:flagellar biosynthesis/type III secretory pathway protein FliH
LPDILKGILPGSETVRIPLESRFIAEQPVPENPSEKEKDTTDETQAAQTAPEEQTPAADAQAEESAEAEPIAPPEPPPLTREELIELYQPELRRICEEEAQRAYLDARMRKAGELKQCIAEVEQRMEELEDQQHTYMTTYAKDLKYLAVEIAEKFVNQKINENDRTLQKLVMNTVGKVKNANWMTVELSDRLVELIGYLKTELQKPEYHGGAEVSPISAPADTVRVTTDSGTIDASVSVQANNLRSLFGSMDEHK